MFRFSPDYRHRLLALPALVRRGGGAPEGAAGARKGGRLEFSEHRPYVPGDEPRDIDWNTWMRLDLLVTKEYRRDEAPEVMVLLDRSASMGEDASPKDRVAREVAGGLAYAALAAKCRVVVALLGEGGPVTVGTYASHRKVDLLLSMLEGLGGPLGPTRLSGLKHLRPAPAAGRVTFLVSDFLVDPLPTEGAVALARGAGVACFLHLVTEDERHLVLAPSCTLVDPETGERFLAPDGRRLAEAHAQELAAHEEAVAALARRHGLGSLVFSDAEPFERTVLAALGARERR